MAGEEGEEAEDDFEFSDDDFEDLGDDEDWRRRVHAGGRLGAEMERKRRGIRRGRRGRFRVMRR